MSNDKPKKFSSFSDFGKATGHEPNQHKYPEGNNENLKNTKPPLIPKPNIGWMYYKDYFNPKSIDFHFVLEKENKDLKKENADTIKRKNEQIINEAPLIPINDELGVEGQKIELKVNYPGLITGVGITHEAGVEGEFKLGVHFDYTFGCPVIHGSSVKGLIRSVFPGNQDRYEKSKLIFLTKILSDITQTTIEEAKIKQIENEIFEGKTSDKKSKSIYQRDIFYDAIVVGKDKNNRFLESDSITPHRNPLKNPVPLPFLKISAGSTMRFRFDLKKGEILNAGQKKDFIKTVLLSLGIGAKTNVGYGQFIPKIS